MKKNKDVKQEHVVSHGRRKFFGTVAAGAASSAIISVIPQNGNAQAIPASSADNGKVPSSPDASGAADKSVVGPPSSVLTIDEIGPVPADQPVNVGKTGSDFMVDVIKTLDVEYCAVLPGSTFRALQESLINYGNSVSPENTKPQLITCTNEDIATSLAHGYAKVANKPMMALVHGVVGLQHASMGIYNAWCDRAPMVVVVGNTLDSAGRAPAGAEFDHSAQDNAAIVRDFTKWDDQPTSLESFAMSMVRAKTIATSIPYAPTVIVADNEIGESEMNGPDPWIPPLQIDLPPAGNPDAIKQAAQMLAAAQFPVIIADRLVRTQNGMDTLVAIAEALGAAVVDDASRLNMPTQHPLNVSWAKDQVIPKADLILALEPVNLFGDLYKYRDLPNRTYIPIIKPGTKVITIGSGDLLMHANFQDSGRFQPVDVEIVGDGETTLPVLLEAIKQALPASQNISGRAQQIKSIHDAMHQRIRQAATYGWNDSPISVPRICAELGYLIKDYPWALVTPQDFQSFWPSKLWKFDKAYQYKGNQGGFGVGYEPGATTGAALAHRDANEGRLSVSIIGDGSLMMNPGALWTMAHHNVPLLTVVHNNRGWHQEQMHVQRMADRHSRGITRAVIGTTMTDPNIDFAKLADSMGVWNAGPISDPNALKPALQQAIDIVRQGKPALIDVVSQGR